MRVDLLPSDFHGMLAKIIEESGEVLKAAGKLQRFGAKAIDPKTKKEYDNVAKLFMELTDLELAIKAFRHKAETHDPWQEMWSKPFHRPELL